MAENNTVTQTICGAFYPPFQFGVRSVNLVAVCVVNFIFFLGGSFLNCLVIFVFLSSTVLQKKLCYFLIMLLSCIDLVVVVLIHPLAVLYSISELTRSHICSYEKLYNRSRSLLCGFSGYTLLVMNVERYVAIVHPYFHQRTVTRWKLLLLVGLCWIFMLTSWLIGTQLMVLRRVMTIASVLLFLLLSIPIYARIHVIARKKRKERVITPGSCQPTEQSSRRDKDHLRAVKFAWIYLLIVLCFFICYLPVALANGLEYLELNPGSQSAASLSEFSIWAKTFLTLNSTFNCLIFFWKTKTLRNESKKLLKCFRRSVT